MEKGKPTYKVNEAHDNSGNSKCIIDKYKICYH